MTDTTTIESTPATAPDKDIVLAVAKAIHAVKDPAMKDHDGHPWMSDATWFVAALDAYFGEGPARKQARAA
jgi:hypothetical protein